MIEHIQATNFRRYEDFELMFESDAQLILIDGANGAGKTTILEAIHYALWGEGRSGRRNLDQLVRRGAELEGMQVQLTFKVGSDRYTVNRRRDGRSSTAVLYCNDEPLVEGPNEVSEEVGRILGMDAAGFRLAVTAQQDDLDGLVSLRPAERSRMVSRLLRLDAIAAARASANDTARQERMLAKGLQHTQDLEDLAAREEKVLGELAAARRAEKEAAEAVSAALEGAENLKGLEEEYQRNLANVTRHLAMLEEVQKQQHNLREQISRLDATADTPPADEPARSSSEVERTLGEARLKLMRAETTNERFHHRSSLQKDVAELEKEAAKIEDARATVGPRPETPVSAEELEAAESAHATALTAHQVAENKIRSLGEGMELPDVCPTCEQEVAGEVRARHARKQQDKLHEANENLRKLRETLTEREREKKRLAEMRAAYMEEFAAWRERAAGAASAAASGEEVQRRLRVYRERIQQLPEEKVDVVEIAGAVEQLESELEAVSKQEAAIAESARRKVELETLTHQLQQAEERAEDHEKQADEWAPGDALKDAHSGYEKLTADAAAEKELRTHWAQQVAMLEERERAIITERKTVQAQIARQQEHQQSANIAAGAVRILSEAASTLSGTIRPELEAALTRLLAQMSEGRFPRAAIGEDYEVTVEDDGQLRGIEELSGGEKDLVALALRLALSQTFTTHSGEGAGFLILDECFGSQDPDRRRAILTALRELRGEYRQLFIISHVEGLEDSADSVIHVERPEEGPSTANERS